MVNFLAVNGQFRFDYGTSASAPIISSIVALINDARKSAGKKPVGFINPAVRFFSFYRWSLKLN